MSVMRKMTKLSWNYRGFLCVCVCVRLECNITHQYILPETILLEIQKYSVFFPYQPQGKVVSIQHSCLYHVHHWKS